MAADMFLKIEGPAVPGESKDKIHSGEIEVLSFSWGVSQAGSGAYGSGGLGAAKASFQDFSITKYVDKASARLNLAVSDGTHFGKFIITVRKAGGTEPVEYMVYTLENVIITSYQIGGSGGDILMESLSCQGTIVKYEYKGQDGKGLGKNEGNYGWDITANAVV